MVSLIDIENLENHVVEADMGACIPRGLAGGTRYQNRFREYLHGN